MKNKTEGAEDVEDIIEQVELAQEHVERAAEALESAMKMVRRSKLDLSYDMEGNMRAYVYNYLMGGVDSITDKLEKYARDLEAAGGEELGEPEEEPTEPEAESALTGLESKKQLVHRLLRQTKVS